MESLGETFWELSDDMVGVFDFDWHAIRLNSVWSRELGWSPEELYSMCFKDLIHPDDLKTAEVNIRSRKPNENIKNVFYRHRCKNGTYKYLNWNFRLVPETRRVYCTARDITRQIIYDQVLKQTNRAVRLGIWNIDVVSGDAYWSPELYELFELDPQKDILTVETSLQLFIPEDIPKVIENYERLVKEGVDFDYEATLLSVRGRQVPVRIIGSALKENNVISRVFGIVQDISKIKEGDRALRYQQAMLNELLDALPSVVYVKDVEGRYVLVNGRFEEFLNKSKSQIIGKKDEELFSKEDATRHVDKDQEVLHTRRPLKTVEEVYQKGDEEVHFLSEKFPLLDDNEEILAVAGVSTDITALHKYQQELEKARDLAEAGTRAKSDFLANMSHEIRTPMNSIIGMADILLDTHLDDEQKKIVLIMSRASENLLQLINDILDLSKIEAGVMSFEKASFSVADIIKRCIELLMVKALEKKLSLEYEVSSDVPEKITGDATRVQQVLINLIGNGLKFTSEGGVHVHVSKEVREDNSAHIRFSVKDTGIGLEPQQQAVIFTRFAQADSSITRRFGGTGLGLSISQELVERMGGRIGVESQVGKGSDFYFTLPVSESFEKNS